VDSELVIRAWNSRAEDLWGLRSEEARGMHIATLDIGLPVEGLVGPIRDCLASRIDDYEHVYQATNRRGRPIACRVSISPLTEPRGPTSGVVVLMAEVDDEARAGG
jgi:two-component system CheB/CheR fusion protein